MKKIIIFLFVFCSYNLYAQDISVLLKQAVNYERTLKEDSALLIYKEVLSADAVNMQALIKSSLLTTAAGARQPDKQSQRAYFDKARDLADKALAIDSNNTDAIYSKGLAALKISAIEPENKKMAEWIREAYLYATKALTINPAFGKAAFLLGKWNFEIITTAWTKKAAVKVLYGGIPGATIDNAILYMEKSRIAEPYFVQNFLELGKAYKFNNNPSKAIEILNKLVKLPNRTADDAAWKAEGKKLLEGMQ